MNYVFLAGIGNSDPEHWQSIWFRSWGPSGHWLEHADWDHPVAEEWVRDLERCLRGISGPTVLVAHSLGCLVVAEWAKRHQHPEVKGAFLVSVPDPAGAAFPPEAKGFGAALDGRLPFPAVMVASTNDRYGSIDHARRTADRWGIPLENVGALGHINLASNLGEWQQGRDLLGAFLSRT
jgi:predicted alpha/beta hydrolase family esterase